MKTNFCSKFSIKTLPYYRCKCRIESLKSLYTFFDTYLDHLLAKFEPNRTVQNVKNFELFDEKSEFLKITFDKALTPFYKTFL